jgi:hypothetical protein
MLTLARWYRNPEDEDFIEQALKNDTLIHATPKRRDY